MHARFNLLDWSVLAAYLLAMLAIGVYFARRQRTLKDYFLADRGIPVWAAAISIVATSVSAVTFIGAPEDAFNGNLTYLSLNLAGLIAVILVALFFVPAFYRHGVASIYEIIGRRFGPGAQRAASGMFMLGRVFASGARLYVAAIPFSLIAFGSIEDSRLYLAIAIVATIATLYTMIGGIRAVIWTETPQTLLFIGAAIAAIVLLLRDIPAPASEIARLLADAKAADGSSKLTLLDTRLSASLPYSLWSAIAGLTLFNMAVYGADQDLAQRMLTCRNAVRGAWSAILSNFIGLGVALLFLCIGLLLYVYHQRPEVFAAAGANPPAAPPNSRQVFLSYILERTPAGLRGLMMAGVFAAAMSSLASALSAMASTAIVDFYKPWRPHTSEKTLVRASRLAVVAWGAILAAFACLCVGWQKASGEGLLPFAIGVMIFAYTGLLAVFLTALFTRRGNATSVIAALLAGFAVIALIRFGPKWPALTHLVPKLEGLRLSIGWQMFIGTALAFGVCMLGRGDGQAAVASERPALDDAPVPAADDIATLIGRLLMVGVRGATPQDPALERDLADCRAAKCRAVILFDADAPALHARLAAGESREAALARCPRNILSPEQTRDLTAYVKDALGPGTIVAVDQEGGEVARLSPKRGFPCTLSAAAIGALGAEQRAHECAALVHAVASAGFNLNLAPCVDVAVNESSPIIAGRRRAFSSDPAVVAACAETMLLAHRAAGGGAVRACVKHFPGHGSAREDSHKGFTDITTTWQEEIELAPYRALLAKREDRGAGAFVMTGHLFHAGIDKELPASLSRAHTTTLLRKRLGFAGPVITDSLDMRAITDRWGVGQACLLALDAGADMLLDANNMPAASAGDSQATPRECPALEMHRAITRALRDGAIEGGEARLRESAARIDRAMGFGRGL